MEHRLQIKRIYAPAAEDDGYRVLVDRLWPRGVSKQSAHLDLWAKDITPSTEIRKWFAHRPENFPAFSAAYRAELAQNAAAASFVSQSLAWLAHRNVTLLYAAHDETCNHALVLRDWLLEQYRR